MVFVRSIFVSCSMLFNPKFLMQISRFGQVTARLHKLAGCTILEADADLMKISEPLYMSNSITEEGSNRLSRSIT